MYYQFSAVMVLSEVSLWDKDSMYNIKSPYKRECIINLTFKPVISRRYYVKYFLRPSAPSINDSIVRWTSSLSIRTLQLYSQRLFARSKSRFISSPHFREFAQPSHNFRGFLRDVYTILCSKRREPHCRRENRKKQ